jgi:PiT family inorganic phosphate transporter
MTVLLLLAVGWVAFTNGANANCKGVASLYGSGTTTRRTALVWGTALTFVGSLIALFWAGGLVRAFGGRGLVPDELALTPDFVGAVAVGGAVTSFLATRFGFPVSTTHALVGALLGAGWVGSGSAVQWSALTQQFLYPLFFSPIVAAFAGAFVYCLLRGLRLAPDERTPWLDRLHFLSAGAASLARGWNDTPKMVALLVVVAGLNLHWGFVLVALAIALGGLLDAERVAETLGKKLTAMNPGQGFAASVVTACLVTTASLHSLPVSTTHVSVGALVGMGVVTRQARGRMVGEIVLAWVSTVPCGAVVAGLAYGLLRGW